MSSSFGERLRVTVFGESHGSVVGAVADGFPPGTEADFDTVRDMMARRAPGKALTSARCEADTPNFVSGLHNGILTGAPVCVLIQNSDVKSGDYEPFRDTPRPSHADWTARLRYGESTDLRGGGHFSGRLTAPICALGGLALGILRRQGIEIYGHLYSVGTQRDKDIDLSKPDWEGLFAARQREIPAVDGEAANRMAEAIADAKAAGDSLGGVLELLVRGMPAGLGDPMFGGAENRLASALFGIPGVRGVSFGEGFDAAVMTGSAHNDPYIRDERGNTVPQTNHAGGILGGITTGAPITCRVAVKPTASIGLPQQTLNLSTGETEPLLISGRHDPCIAVRALPAAEAVVALVLLDMLLIGGKL